MSYRHRRVSWHLLVVLSLLLTACNTSDPEVERADTSTTTAAPSTQTTEPPVTATTTPGVPVPELTWEGCGDGECVRFPAPLDYDDPTGPTIELFARRLPATGDRIGSLFFNFGGPGGDAASMITSFPVPDAIRQRFDIVGLDPRGVGASTPLDCGLDPRTLYSADPTIEDQADADRLVAVSRDYVEDCDAERGGLLPHVGTHDVARDLDLLRAAIGDEQLDYVGYSYGTSIGQVYAELFPERVRTMILDGLVDPAGTGIDKAVTQAEGFELALRNWAEGCSGRRSCSFGDPIGAVDEVLARAEQGIPAGRRTVGQGEMAIGLAYPLYQEALWPSLDTGIDQALDGDGRGMLALADAYTAVVDFSAYFAVSCLDSSWPRSIEDFLEQAKAVGRVSPRYGEAIANDYIRCALWPVDAEPLGPVTAPGAPPILVVSGTGDPATPYESGVAVADRLESGVLVTYEGEGHTITFQGDGCIDALAIAYLIDRTVPDDGIVC